MVAPTTPDTSAGNGLLTSIGVANVFLLVSPVLMALVVGCQALPDSWQHRASMALGMEKYWMSHDGDSDTTLPSTIAEPTMEVEMTDIGDSRTAGPDPTQDTASRQLSDSDRADTVVVGTSRTAQVVVGKHDSDGFDECSKKPQGARRLPAPSDWSETQTLPVTDDADLAATHRAPSALVLVRLHNPGATATNGWDMSNITDTSASTQTQCL